jgi:predicted DNA-binding transcriptional regulator AlpA
MSADCPQLLVNEVEARRLLGGLCAKTLYNLRREGLPFVKIGSRVMYDPADLNKWIDSRKENRNEFS